MNAIHAVKIAGRDILAVVRYYTLMNIAYYLISTHSCQGVNRISEFISSSEEI